MSIIADLKGSFQESMSSHFFRLAQDSGFHVGFWFLEGLIQGCWSLFPVSLCLSAPLSLSYSLSSLFCSADIKVSTTLFKVSEKTLLK
jgi:hypothetical protein